MNSGRLRKALDVTGGGKPRPLVALISSAGAPGETHVLDEVVKAVQEGVRSAGGAAFEFRAAGVCATTRSGSEDYADSLIRMLSGYAADAAVFLPGCDQAVPDMVLAACRMDLPCVFTSAGIVRGSGEEPRRRALMGMLGAVSSYASGVLHGEEALSSGFAGGDLPGCALCGGVDPAEGILADALGLSAFTSLCWEGTSKRRRDARNTGALAMELWRCGLRPSTFLTQASICNALVVAVTLGAEPEIRMKLLLAARSIGVSPSPQTVQQLIERTPRLPVDVETSGGVYAVMRELSCAGLADSGVRTVTGTLEQRWEGLPEGQMPVLRKEVRTDTSPAGA